MATLKLVLKRQPTSSIDSGHAHMRKIVTDRLDYLVSSYPGPKQLHEIVVEDWEKSSDKPKFNIEIESSATELSIGVEMVAEAAESATLSVWQLLERGTELRYMHVSPDWKSKTAPRQLSSSPSAGVKTGLYSPPREGIIAREWIDEISKIGGEQWAGHAVFAAYGDSIVSLFFNESAHGLAPGGKPGHFPFF